jgi:hypothetical protein
LIIFWTDASTSQIKKVMGLAISRANEPHRFASSTYDPDPQPGDIVVALGEDAVDQLRAKGIFAKKRTITSLRNSFVESEGVLYTAMFSPGIVDIDAGKQPELDWDVQLIARMHRTKSTKVQQHEYTWVTDFSALIARVKAEYE